MTHAKRGHHPSRKIKDLHELAGVLKGLKKQGKRIVMAHGVFDLLHIGHIRHLYEAKTFGDVLVVTLTPDAFVRKGPHSPAFNEALRAEAVAALAPVDFVALNRWQTSDKTIKLLRPDVYAKGPDYKVASEDVTGMITKETAAVRSVGGVLRCTEDITFSSSSLINRHLPVWEPGTAQYLERFRRRHPFPEIKERVCSFEGLKVLVVGEAIVDEYVYCVGLGKSAKEPVLALQHVSEDRFAGGALAIANHAAEFCGKVTLLTYLGEDDRQEGFARRSLRKNVRMRHVVKAGSPTIVKRRIVEKHYVNKFLEIYFINDAPLAQKEDSAFCRMLAAELPRHDVVICADYGHGLISPRARALLSRKSRFLAVNTQINAANIGFHTISHYNRADYVCIHEGEIRLDNRSRQGDVRPLVRQLAKRMRSDMVMVTRGHQGTMVFSRKAGFDMSPALAQKLVDRVGAGDAVLAVTALAAASGAPADVTAFLGNIAGAQAVAYVGNSAHIQKISVLKSAEALLK